MAVPTSPLPEVETAVVSVDWTETSEAEAICGVEAACAPGAGVAAGTIGAAAGDEARVATTGAGVEEAVFEGVGSSA